MEELDLASSAQNHRIAGLSRLAVAKNFHQLNPEKSLVILEAASSLGGTWAKDRLYPSLKSNNMLGTYQHPDLLTNSKIFNVNPGEHIPGNAIRYSHRSATVEHRGGPEGGWISDHAGHSRLSCWTTKARKDSTLLFHSRDFLKNSATIDTANSVTVFGGTKSSWDAVYAYAIKGVHQTGHGPVWMLPPLRHTAEDVAGQTCPSYSRSSAHLAQPLHLGTADGYTRIRNFLHGTAFGRKIVDAFWVILGNDVITLNQYDKHPEVKKLKPWSQAMFTASSFSILNYPTDFLRPGQNGTVTIHIADMTTCRRRLSICPTVFLQTDAFMSTTGWRHAQSIKYMPEGIDMQLGIPIASTTLGNARMLRSGTIKAVDNADREILSRFPRL
ncbi:hypothetical protein PG989_000487 [Apiospora arundinis]